MKPVVQFIETLVYRGFEKFGRYYSCYRGFVISNEDPDGLNRLQLKVPNVYGNQIMTYGAWPKGNFSGPGYGMQCLPQQGDVVWVEFEHGSPRRPVWSHGYFAKDEKPEGDNFARVNNYWFRTPGGHTIELDDETGEIKILSSDGKIILNTGAEPAVLGDTLQTQLDVEKARVAGIINAISSAPVLAGDGGATFKAALIAATSPLIAPNYDNIKSDNITLD